MVVGVMGKLLLAWMQWWWGDIICFWEFTLECTCTYPWSCSGWNVVPAHTLAWLPWTYRTYHDPESTPPKLGPAEIPRFLFIRQFVFQSYWNLLKQNPKIWQMSKTILKTNFLKLRYLGDNYEQKTWYYTKQKKNNTISIIKVMYALKESIKMINYNQNLLRYLPIF